MDSNKYIEPLKNMDLAYLIKRQIALDKKFKEKMGLEKLNPNLIKIAYLDEVGELIHELKPLWCYWKKNNKEVNKRRVLEELSDCLHFALSYEINKTKDGGNIIEYYNTSVAPFEKTLRKLPKIKYLMFSIVYLLQHLGYTQEEFLEVHHQVWLNNMNIRTGDDY